MSKLSFSEKVRVMKRPGVYPESPGTISTIETHMSHVFLTRDHAYKMKKSVENEYLDFSTLEKRRKDCEREVRLNRRLAGDVYIGAVPLATTSTGDYRLGGDGPPVEWLVKMKRLPEERMLDVVLENDSLPRNDVLPAAQKLATFYREADPVDVTPPAFLDDLRGYVRENEEVLTREKYDMPGQLVNGVVGSMYEYMDASSCLGKRVEDGRIVDGHGDLRPQHICLVDPPVFFDCLEFNEDYRRVDPVDELAYLSIECERLERPDVSEWFREIYRDMTGDEFPAPLLSFYRVYRATLRAKLSLWHIRGREYNNPDRWIGRARRYLRLVEPDLETLSTQRWS